MHIYTHKYTYAQMMDKVQIPLDSPPTRPLTCVTPHSSLARDGSRLDIWEWEETHPLVMKHADCLVFSTVNTTCRVVWAVCFMLMWGLSACFANITYWCVWNEGVASLAFKCGRKSPLLFFAELFHSIDWSSKTLIPRLSLGSLNLRFSCSVKNVVIIHMSWSFSRIMAFCDQRLRISGLYKISSNTYLYLITNIRIVDSVYCSLYLFWLTEDNMPSVSLLPLSHSKRPKFNN